jgi:UDP-4-amino-4,6-dideoxy-N-acetyl-beta-L-altrosamine transaminase
MIPYGKQSIGDADIQAVIDALSSEYLTTGPLVSAFEKKVADYCGAKHAIAVSNGTAALHVATMALGLGKKDQGITSPNTFLASANCMAYCGAKPGFADITTDTYCLDSREIEKNITPDTKLLIPVHFAGHPCDMPVLWELAREHGLYVIEDAAHALGSSYQDHQGNRVKVGSCAHSHLTIFSFHPVKNITTGEGGMILTNDDGLAKKCRNLRSHGMEREPDSFYGLPVDISLDGPWYYEMQSLGYNYRLTDLQCALGIAQMDQLDRFIQQRRAIWERYNAELGTIREFTIPTEKAGCFSAWHLYAARTPHRNALLKALREKGIGAHAMYIPVHLQPWYRKQYGYARGDYPEAEKYFDTCVVLPLYPLLTHNEQSDIITAVQTFFKRL